MNILITGASEGIGHAVARRFAAESGNKIFVAARRKEKLQELASLSSVSPVFPVPIDLATYDYSNIITAFETAGVSHIDILINNAGLLINKPFSDLLPGDWEEIYRVNVISPAQLIRSLLGYMGVVGKTHIVNIGSIGGIRGSLKFAGLSAYSSSKGALAILTECLAEEFREKNIAVNCLALGSVQTEMLARAFPGYVTKVTSEEIAGFIFDFGMRGSMLFNGKIVEISSTNP